MRVLITGTSSGIGNALAHEYLKKGAEVLGISRSTDEELAGKKSTITFHRTWANWMNFPGKSRGLPARQRPSTW
jgi:NADP-dependent 3-hydroxy acid dehydrogenase YdfG